MILDEIVRYKREFVREQKARIPLSEIRKAVEKAPPPGDFLTALQAPPGEVRIIAEVKKASPSKGVIREDFEPVKIARRYEECGAAAVSVLTDEKYFQGSLDFLRRIRREVDLPLLRKEFIIDEYQIFESRAAGADAVLLIAAILEDSRLSSFYRLSRDLNMSALVEVHTKEEWERVKKISPRILGVNNRNLKDFTVDLSQTFHLRKEIPLKIVMVSESGIRTPEDLRLLSEHRIQAALIGETLMRAGDPGVALQTLISFH